jgi:hypothetical protein
VPFNVLILPLLGGYFFISYWNYTRFDSHRYSGERLIFHSAAAGVIFLILSFCITNSIVGLWPELDRQWNALVPVAEITSFNLFDEEAYNLFNPAPSSSEDNNSGKAE